MLAVGQHADVEFLKKVPERSHRPRQRRRGRRAHARGRRHLRGRRHDRRRADDDGGRRPREEGGAQYRRVPPRHGLREAGAAPARPVREAQPHRLPRRGAPPAGRAAGRAADRVRGDRVRALGARGALRGVAVPLLRQLLRVRQLLRRLSRAGDREAGQGPVLPRRARSLHRLRRVLRAVPVPRDRDGARARRGRAVRRPTNGPRAVSAVRT